MEARRPPEYPISLSADRSNVRDVVKGILHTIFFHRFFTPLYPATHEVLDLTLPYVSDDDIEELVEQRTTAFVRQLEGGGGVASNSHAQNYNSHAQTGYTTTSPYNASTRTTSNRGRGQLVVQFLEKKRRKGWFGGKADEELPWETWIVEVTLLTSRGELETERNRETIEKSLSDAVMRIVATVNRERNHIPPITTNESNPFPYQIVLNPKNDGWGQKMSIF